MFVYNRCGFQNNNLKDILLLYIFCLFFSKSTLSFNYGINAWIEIISLIRIFIIRKLDHKSTLKVWSFSYYLKVYSIISCLDIKYTYALFRMKTKWKSEFYFKSKQILLTFCLNLFFKIRPTPFRSFLYASALFHIYLNL